MNELEKIMHNPQLNYKTHKIHATKNKYKFGPQEFKKTLLESENVFQI